MAERKADRTAGSLPFSEDDLRETHRIPRRIASRKTYVVTAAAANSASFDDAHLPLVFIEQITFVGQQVKASCQDLSTMGLMTGWVILYLSADCNIM